MEMINGFLSVFEPLTFIYLLIGVLAGSVLGVLPGLTATMGVAVLTPLTFWLPPSQGFAMLIGVYNSALWAGGITAILINTPGTPASIASTFDGYAMTKRGEAGIALGINTIYSVIGGLFSTLVLAVFSFPLSNFALGFGPSEYFAVSIWGITMMAAVSNGSVIKGLILGVAGLLVSTIGIDPMLGFKRFTFGNTNLLDGISFVPVLIGMFGLSEILYQISTYRKEEQRSSEVLSRIRIGSVFMKWTRYAATIPSTIMSSVVSVIVGAIPGAGGDIASIICWGQAKKMSKKSEEFGKGSVEGLASSCTANNGVIGGALTTMLTLGIPGDAVTAVLIGSLMVYGIQPGPAMFVENQPLVMTIIALMVMANLIILVFGLATSKISTKILLVNQKTIWVTVIILCVVGSFALNNSFYDVVFMVIGGLLGFLFRKLDFPAGPFILGLLLGKLVESNLRRGLSLTQGSYIDFFNRPITLTIFGLIILSLVWSFKKKKITATGTT
ncbi:MAG: tripartite tricarboxylate transporter permease [Castellaniella sp.]|uniref:tripartite tricarboxylate transporter permease n=1 Tax=Castellaniella sp. TaxID=1955812 RepID=UPI003C796B06